MTRSNAREIAVHLAFALGFSNESADDLLKESLNRENFQQLSGEDPLYQEFPNEKQRQYIQDLVKGVYEHGAELDGYISKYAIGWSFSRISRMAAAVMRVTMYEILYMPDIPAAAAAMVQPARVITPSQERHEEYMFYYKKYRELYELLRDWMHSVTGHAAGKGT